MYLEIVGSLLVQNGLRILRIQRPLSAMRQNSLVGLIQNPISVAVNNYMYRNRIISMIRCCVIGPIFTDYLETSQ